MSFLENYNKIKDEIRHICASIGRDASEVKIVCVTKTHPAETVQEAIDSGIHLFGENKVQEAKGKIPNLKGDFQFHMIGHLQSNKVRDAAALFDIIHSIDRMSTAEAVCAEAKKINKIQKILIQVNASGEETKSGVPPGEAFDLIKKILALDNIKVLGLMTMAPFTEDENIIRSSFRTTKKLLEGINNEFHLELTELSMGMSSDYALAVEEGATMLRIGTAILGERRI